MSITPSYLNVDNSWNFAGLIKSHNGDDGPIIICPYTGDNLYFMRNKISKIMLGTYCICVNCNKEVSIKSMSMADGVQRPSYPIVFEGYWCTECNGLPENSWREKIPDVDC
jgi:hypothetical protein